jgi:type VI secretion system protein ImpH
MLGPRDWHRDLGVRLWAGPLSRVHFDQFLPGGSAAKALKAMLALFAVPNIRFEVRLVLRAQDMAPVVLNAGPRLGYDTVLASKPSAADQDLARYCIVF